MDKKTRDTLIALENKIIKYKKYYYEGRPLISDAEYDALEDTLRKMAPESRVLSLVGSLDSNSPKVAHEKKMLSLAKTYNREDLVKWIENHDVVSTYKLDGVSCSLLYKEGDLVLAKTRGDGSFGEEITPQIMWVESVPKRLKEKVTVEIRGEIYCQEEAFFHLSDEMERRKLERPSSPRNIVAGLMGRKDHLDLSSYLSFSAFEYLKEDDSCQYEQEHFELLKDLGFSIPQFVFHSSKNKESIDQYLDDVLAFIEKGDYQIDGAVFTYNDLKLQKELGHTSHHPRYKMAFKFEGAVAETTIESLLWSVSRNGYLTPVALVSPVELSGATISRVTLHNYGMVLNFHLKVGDKIQIIRSGEVIPKFLSVVESSQEKFEIPSLCPSCKEKVSICDIRLVCNNKNCPARHLEELLNFISKIGIEDLSSKRLEEMVAMGLVKDIPSLYRLTADDLLKMDRFQKKLAEKIIANIQKTKNSNLKTLLMALSLSGASKGKCEKIVNHGFDTWEKIKNLTFDDLIKVDLFAQKTATSFLSSLQSKKEVVEELLKLGFNLSLEKRGGALSGKGFCITGALTEKRSVIEDKIRGAGGVVLSSVTKSCHFLVTNEESQSSKYKKALELGISIISEEELKKILGLI